MIKKVFVILFFIVIIITLSAYQKQIKKDPMSFENLSQKKAVLVIAYQGFQDKEYLETRNVLEKAGINITVSSSIKGEAQGKLGEKVFIDKTINEIDIEDYNALIFIGGPGALEYVEDSFVHQLIRKAVIGKKVLGAICIAPEILAKAGVLNEKRATVWSSPIDQSPVKILENEGAEYINEPVVVDGKIITGNGPEAATEFGQKIVEALNQ